MQRIDGAELWKAIPPEEKFEIMARAQASGILSALVLVVAACTMAVGLQIPALMWGSLVASPLVFQFSAGRSWRALRPAIMLEYLAARSVARRYAFAAKSKDMTPNLIFKGRFEEVFGRSEIQEALEASIRNNNNTEVWLALFSDAVVAMAEAPGGAELRFSHLINDKIEVESQSADNKDYSNSKEVLLGLRHKSGAKKQFKITSDYPAALIVFEKRLRQSLSEVKKVEEPEELPAKRSSGLFDD